MKAGQQQCKCIGWLAYQPGGASGGGVKALA